MPFCAQCFSALTYFIFPPTSDDEIREDFEQTVAFLASVPLLRQQLPRAELPKVAQHLQRKVWQPGQTLVTQGETGKFLYLIQSGEAIAVTCDGPNEPQNVRCTLAAGDYFGGHTLITERPNIATIIAGDNVLVTLSLSRRKFDSLGLKSWLSFPKRPALYDASASARQVLHHKSCKPHSDQPLRGLAAGDEAFVRKAFRQNANLRALFEASDEQIDEIIATAERRSVRKGEVVAKCDALGDEFFIIREGSFDMILELPASVPGVQQSAESQVTTSLLAERIVRKQNFLKAISQRKPNKGGNEAARSMFGGRRAEAMVGTPNNRRSFTFFGDASRSPATTKRAEETVPSGQSVSLTLTSNISPTHGATMRRKSSRIEMPRTSSMSSSLGSGKEQEAGVLYSGDSFGELSILFNAKREATYRAREDSVVYVIAKSSFKSIFGFRDKRQKEIQEYVKLLEEVHLLSPLLSSETYDLACNAVGFMDIEPETRVLHQGIPRKDPYWYIIAGGKADVTLTEGKGVPETTLAQLSRGAHFGERSLVQNKNAALVNVSASSEGLRLLTFHGEAALPILRKVMKYSNESTEGVCDIKEWWVRKARGFKNGNAKDLNNLMTDNSTWQRMCSGGDTDIALADLTRVCTLGKGGFGEVSLVEHNSSGKNYALKTCSKGHIEAQGCQRLICWERELLTMIDSSFIIRLHRTFKDEQHIYFLLEAALGGSLVDIMRHNSEVLGDDSPRGSNTAFYVACIIAALDHLHERSIVHRDLKPENTLLNGHGYAKVCDMGFSRFVLTKTNTLAGTPEYMAPEVIDFPHTHNSSVDWWALGVLTYELLAGQTPWDDDGEEDQHRRLMAIRRSQEQGDLRFGFHFPHAAKGFVSALLKLKPQQRLGAKPGGAEEVRKHNMYERLKFDFGAFHKQEMEAPFKKENYNTKMMVSDDFGMHRGEQHGLDPQNSIFISSSQDSEGWDKDF